MKVVVIGAAGYVGRMVLPALAREHEVRVADLHPERVANRPNVEVVAADVNDYATIKQAVEGQDALVYMAMGSMEQWGELGGWAESHFDVNVKGIFLSLRAAAESGIRQAVYTSTLSIFDSFRAYGHELEDREPDATDTYGMTKRLGEEVCKAACRRDGMDIVALRLCAPTPDEKWRASTDEGHELLTGATDVAAAYVAALRYEAHGFEPFVIVGDHEERSVSWKRSRERLGWEPTMRRSGVDA